MPADEQQQNKISREDKYILLGSMWCDRKEIECKMWMGSKQFMIPSQRMQFKPNWVEAGILFCPFRAFSKFCSSHRDEKRDFRASHRDFRASFRDEFFLFRVKWCMKSSFHLGTLPSQTLGDSSNCHFQGAIDPVYSTSWSKALHRTKKAGKLLAAVLQIFLAELSHVK